MPNASQAAGLPAGPPAEGSAGLGGVSWGLVILLLVLVALAACVVVVQMMAKASLSARSAESAAPSAPAAGAAGKVLGNGEHQKFVCGGGTTAHPGLSSTELFTNTRSFVSSANAGEHHPSDAINIAVEGGGRATSGDKKKKEPLRPWREYDTWEDLMQDKGALNVYWEERNEVLNNLPTDWTKVRKQCAPLVKDPYEWAGHIDLVDGRLQIVSKYPSKNQPGRPEWSAVRASVSPEVSRRVWAKPALFVYHTHPIDNEAPTMAQPPSSADLSVSVFSSFKGHYAAELVLSPNAIYMYGLRAARRTALWNSSQRTLEVSRVAFDVYTAFSAMRSYAEYYTMREIEGLAHKFGFFFVTYPDDNFAQPRYNLMMQLRGYVDMTELRTLADELDKIQRDTYEPEANHSTRGAMKREPLPDA